MIDQFLRDIYYPANEGVIQRIKEIRTKYLAKNKKEKKELNLLVVKRLH